MKMVKWSVLSNHSFIIFSLTVYHTQGGGVGEEKKKLVNEGESLKTKEYKKKYEEEE